MDKLQQLESRGISGKLIRGVMAYDSADGVIRTDYQKTAKMLARDNALQTLPSTGIPSALVTYVDPRVTTVLFGATNATKLFNEQKIGSWVDNWMTFPVEEMAGSVTPYSDATNNVSTDVNVSFPSRENFVFQTTIQYGTREVETSGAAGLQLAGRKQYAAASILARAANSFYLFGVKGKRVYGALNDPNIPASESPRAFDGVTTWEQKSQKADPTTGIYGDIQHLIGKLIGRNGGLVDQNTPMVLAVATSRFGYLTMSNAFGKTALSILKENYPNLEVIQLPELETAAGKMLYLTVPEMNGEATAENCYSEKMRFSNVEQRMTMTTQKAIGATWGCVVKRPSLIATMTGI